MADRPNRILFECPEPLRARLLAYAAATGLSQAEIIRGALNACLPPQTPPEGT